MRFLMFLSDALIPILVFYIVGFGILMKKNVYDDFLKGAKEGIQTVVGILPTLVGLMVAVGILRASGLLDFISTTCMGWTKHIGIPSELIPIAIVKMFSSSAATGLLVDLYKEAGCDSFVGMAASVMLSCTETIFYTMSIYFMSVKVRKTGFTLPEHCLLRWQELRQVSFWRDGCRLSINSVLHFFWVDEDCTGLQMMKIQFFKNQE